MDIRQLRTFRTVAELGSLSKAADRLRIAQPGLSRQIKLLEQELRVQLFVRNGRGMLLTGAGRMLLDRTEGLVRQIEQMRDDIQSAGGNPSGSVVLGLVPTVSAVLSGRLAARILAGFPDISQRIVESYGGHLVEWLHRGEMDLAITYGPAIDLHLTAQSIGFEEIAVVGPPGSGLRARKQVDLDWLLKQKLILPSMAHGLRALLEKAVVRRRMTLKALIEVDSYRAQISLMEEGDWLHPPAGIRYPRRTCGKAAGDGRSRQPDDYPRTGSRLPGGQRADDCNNRCVDGHHVGDRANVRAGAVENQDARLSHPAENDNSIVAIRPRRNGA